MKKLLNKKGFTLVEMLVVIAIIAILVAVIVPTVTSSTDKAKAASDAANLRSIKAEIGIAMLSTDSNSVVYDATKKVVTVGTKAGHIQTISVPPCNVNPDWQFAVNYDDKTNTLTVKYDKHTIDQFASVASGSKKVSEIASESGSETPTVT